MDEQTGKAGYLTRLEAFTDLMRRRKRKLEKETKEKEPKHARLPTRKSGWRQRKKLTPEESEKILKRVFLGIDDENEN
jgi:hypothetical protein